MNNPTQAEALRIAQALCDKLDAVHADERFKSVWVLSANRGMPYNGPTYGAELAALKAILAAPVEQAPNLAGTYSQYDMKASPNENTADDISLAVSWRRNIDRAEDVAPSPEPAQEAQEPIGVASKQSWWAGYRAGKGLPPDTPRQEALAAPAVSAVPVQPHSGITDDRILALARKYEIQPTYYSEFDFDEVIKFARDLLAFADKNQQAAPTKGESQ